MRDIQVTLPDGQTLSRDWLDSKAEGPQNILRQHYGSRLVCGCNEKMLPLCIVNRGSYFLRRAPETGPEHEHYCPSYEPSDTFTGRQIYERGVIKEDDEGYFHLKLSIPLGIRSGANKKGDGETGDRVKKNEKKNGMELLGLLHCLWEAAKFHRWSPRMEGRRRYPQIYKYLIDAARNSKYGRNKSLLDNFWMPPPWRPENEEENELARKKLFAEVMSRNQRIIIVGKIHRIVHDNSKGTAIKLFQTDNNLLFWITPKHETAIADKSQELLQKDMDAIVEEDNIFIAATVERGSDTRYNVNHMAIMVTTHQFIPYRSIEEKNICNKLVENKRHFIKMLEYDSGGKVGIPNFYLIDGEDKMPMYIINDTERKIDKLRMKSVEENLLQNIPMWHWYVTAECPSLPSSST